MPMTPPVCTTCGVEAVGTCALCGGGFCWSHGDGIPAGTPGRVHAACATLASSRQANDARDLARQVAAAGFGTGDLALTARMRTIWSVVGDEDDDDPQRRFRRVVDVIVVDDHRGGDGSSRGEPGLAIDADGHFWDLHGPARASVVRRGLLPRPGGRWHWRRAEEKPDRSQVVTAPGRGLTGARRRSDDLAAAAAGERELRGLRSLAEGRPGPFLA